MTATPLSEGRDVLCGRSRPATSMAGTASVTEADLQAFMRTHKRTRYTFGPDGSLIPLAD